MRRCGALVLFVLLSSSGIEAAQLKVCATCPYTNAQLQNALDAAVPGDEVLIERGHIYVAPSDSHVLGSQCKAAPKWDCITLRTGVEADGTVMSLSLFPPAGIRMTAAYRGVMAKLIPSVNNTPALRTIYPGEIGPTCAAQPCRADGWTVKWIEFGPKADYAQRALVRFGSNNAGREWNGSCATWPDPNPSCWNTQLPNGQTQDTLIEVPQYLSFIQNDVHGDPFVGQAGGLLLATKDARVLHNSFTDIKSVTETQALTGLNGIGPYDVENNLFEATGENTMWGGDDPYLILRATVGSSPTTTSVTLTSPVWYSRIDTTTQPANLATDIYSGIFVSVTHAGITYTGMTCTLSGTTCTLSPALPVTPSPGDFVQWDWIHGGLTFRYNYERKPLAWFGDILPIIPSSGITATPGTGESLSAGTYCYRVMWFAYVSGVEGSDVQSEPSVEKCATVGAGGKVGISWPAQAHATRYWVYGRASGAQTMTWEVNASTTTYVDTGSAGTANTPLPHGHNWTVKNGHERKNCEGAGPMGPCLEEGNVIERSWCCTQSNAVAIKINNQDGNDNSSTVRNYTFRNNWIKHVHRAIALSTSNADTYGGGTMRDVTITNNLFTDLAQTWIYPPGSESNSAIIITAGASWVNVLGNLGCLRCTLTHNSSFANTSTLLNGPMLFATNRSADTNTDLILRDNILARECSSCSAGSKAMKTFNPGNAGEGTSAWTAATSGASAADHNAFPDGSSGTYTAGPFTSASFITDATMKSTHLANYTNCDTDIDILGCAVLSSSSLYHAASDGTDIGANIATIKTMTDIALSGDMSGGTPPPPPTTVGRPRIRIRLRGWGL
jgi:hypothetical protein